MILAESDMKGGLFHPSVRDKTENQMQFPQSIDAFVISDLENKLKCRLSFIREGDKLIHENCFGFQRQYRCEVAEKLIEILILSRVHARDLKQS